MNSTNNSKPDQCPPVPEALVEWLESLHQPIKSSRHIDLRDLDFKSGQLDVVTYLRSQLDKQRN